MRRTVRPRATRPHQSRIACQDRHPDRLLCKDAVRSEDFGQTPSPSYLSRQVALDIVFPCLDCAGKTRGSSCSSPVRASKRTYVHLGPALHCLTVSPGSIRPRDKSGRILLVEDSNLATEGAERAMRPCLSFRRRGRV